MIPLPGYVKFFFIIATSVLVLYILQVAQPIIAPIVTAFILSLLMHPLGAQLEKWGVGRGVSSFISIITVCSVLFLTFYFISVEVRTISRDMTEIRERFDTKIDRVSDWMEQTFGVQEYEQSEYLKESFNNMLRNSSTLLTRTASATAGFITSLVLTFLSLFFLLFYRRFFVNFLYRVISERKHRLLKASIMKVQVVVRSYLLGIFTVIMILAVLNSVVLALIGIKFAIFFGVLAALLTIVPYIGVFIGSSLAILYALLTTDSLWYPFAVFIAFQIIQFLEGNFITPNVVGNQVSLNPFVIIVGLFVGGMLWGPIGMILAIPLIAILKVVFDAIEPLQPYGYLLGYPPKEDRRGVGKKKEKTKPPKVPGPVKEKV